MRAGRFVMPFIGLMCIAVCVSIWTPHIRAVSESQEEAAIHSHDDARHESGESDVHLDEHEGHLEAVVLTPEQVEKSGIRIAEAAPGMMPVTLTMPGQVKLNADRVAHVVPRIPGVVREVSANLGDEVKAGAIMAVLDSRELAELKAGYLASRERQALAESTFERELGLWKQKISAEQDHLTAKNALAEARIATQAAEQQLHAIGFSEEYVSNLSNQPHVSLTRYKIVAPFDGTIIEKHITLGEALKDDATAFIVADLGTVWIDFNVYQKDWGLLRKGQQVRVENSGEDVVQGTISYIGSVMGEDSKTFTARVVMDNQGGKLRPGLFVTGVISVEQSHADILVPKNAIQALEDKEVVFLQEEGGFVPVPVVVGRRNASDAEILEGLTKGQRFVTDGSFLLKATIEKGELGHEH